MKLKRHKFMALTLILLLAANFFPGIAPAVGAETPAPPFNDLAGYEWASDALSALKTDGVVQGDGSGGYNPGGNVTRAELAAIICRAFKLQVDPKAVSSFSGDSEWNAQNKWAIQYIEAAKRFFQFSGDTFDPGSNVTFEEITFSMLTFLGLDTSSEDVMEAEATTIFMLSGLSQDSFGERESFQSTDEINRAEAAVFIYTALHYHSSPTPPTPTNTLNILDSSSEIDNGTIDLLKDLRSNLDNIGTGKDALNASNELISKLPEALKKTKNELVSEELMKIVTLIAEKAVALTGKEAVRPTFRNETASAAIDDSVLKNFQARTDMVLKTSEGLQKKLADNKIEDKLKTRVIAEIPETEKAKEVEADISKSMLDMLKTKGIDRLEVSSDIASVALSPKTLDIKESNRLQLSVEKVDNDKELNSVQQKTVKDNPVYDINASLVNKDGLQKKITQFNDPLEIKIPYVLPEGGDPAKITVFYLDDKGNVENMAGYYNPITKTVSFTTKHLCLFTIEEYKVDFKDIKESKSYKVIIEQLASQGVVKGSDGKFKPDQVVTRAQYVEMIVRTFKIADLYNSPVECQFSDVKKKDWFYNSVAVAVKAGVVNGGSDGKFRPNESISRQEMAVITSQAAKVCKNLAIPEDIQKYLDFSDAAKIQGYAKPPVSMVSKYNVMGPKKDKEFKPVDYVDRVDAALTIYNLIWVQNPEKNQIADNKTPTKN